MIVNKVICSILLSICVVPSVLAQVEPPEFTSTSESAFAYQAGGCLIESGNGRGKGGRWGWYLEFSALGGLRFAAPLIAGAGLCDLESGTQVGFVNLAENVFGDLDVIFEIDNNDGTPEEYYTLGSIHVYAGCELPASLAPGTFEYSDVGVELVPGLWIGSVVVDRSDVDCEPFYVIAHAEVEVWTEES